MFSVELSVNNNYILSLRIKLALEKFNSCVIASLITVSIFNWLEIFKIIRVREIIKTRVEYSIQDKSLIIFNTALPPFYSHPPCAK